MIHHTFRAGEGALSDARLLTPSYELIRAGHTQRQLAARVASGELLRVRPGRYAEASRFQNTPAKEQQLAAIHAAQRALTNPPLFAGRSAATIHGFPAWSRWLHTVGGAELSDPLTVHTLVSPGYRGSRTPRFTASRARVPDSDRELVSGLRVTSRERTLWDIARIAPLEVSLACADHYLRDIARTGHRINDHEWYAWHERMLARAELSPRTPGVARARAVVALAHPGADSPLESVSRPRLNQLGIDVELQHSVPSESGGTLWIDFWFVHAPYFGECDGKIKYTDAALRAGQTADEVVYAEKRREDWLRGVTGRRPARWAAENVHTAAKLGARLTAFGMPVPGVASSRYGPEVAKALARLR